MLLIVPYGIETQSDRRRYLARGILLIVPYGIETLHNLYYLQFLFLLIVPYGIETYIYLR